jgi:dipeptidyl aminopeptidase/acylaminoacyl peptidase
MGGWDTTVSRLVHFFDGGRVAIGRKALVTSVIVLIVLAMAPVCSGKSASTSRTVSCDSVEYRYDLSSPSQDEMLPAVLLLHGAGDHADSFIETWKRITGKKHVVLIAPDLPREVKFEQAAPSVFRCVVEDAKQHALIDPRRVYVFGHSMGGYLAYDAAMFDSEYFAAVAVHAMRIDDDYTWILGRAKRKTPIAIYIGDRDQAVPVSQVRQTRELLVHAGFPVHYVELKGHDHNYYDLADSINEDAWNFLSEQCLP